MRAVVQRVSRAEVRVDGRVVGAIGRGLLALVGAVDGDGDTDLAWMERKLTTLRVFPDDTGRMNHSVVDVGGEMLLVSQFTVCADVGKGTRPSFSRAMEPAAARAMFDALVTRVSAHVGTATGEFQAEMDVDLVNAGPVTLWLDSRSKA